MRLLWAALLATSSVVFADAPGSRIRAGPPDPQPGSAAAQSPAAQRDLERCQAMQGEAKERCLKNLRAATAAEEKKRGPEAIGAGSGASGATSGTSGGGTFGGSAPR